MDSTSENKDVWAAVCPMIAFPLNQPDEHKHTKELFQIYIFYQVDLYDVALLGADLQEKDLKEELDLGLILLCTWTLATPLLGCLQVHTRFERSYTPPSETQKRVV